MIKQAMASFLMGVLARTLTTKQKIKVSEFPYNSVEDAHNGMLNFLDSTQGKEAISIAVDKWCEYRSKLFSG